MAVSLGNKGKRRGRFGGSYTPSAEINVTPLVDVMLVLLIVFMVAAPLLTAGVPVDLPSSDAKPITDEENKPIEITLTKEGKIFIGETGVERAKLIPMLSAMTEGQSDRRIYIRGDKGLEYGGVMELLGALNGAGFTKVALISEATSK
ncbi:MAG: protein TolR [Alphaproteobacteria bacterium]